MLRVNLGKIRLKNPVLPASGTFEAEEFNKFFPVYKLGAIVTKTITFYAKDGNPPPRTCETAAGMLNSIGLQNEGLDYFVNYTLKKIKHLKVPLIVSIGGYQAEEYLKIIKLLDRESGIAGYELNLSCPNIKTGGLNILQNHHLTKELIKKARVSTRKTIIAKISPEGINIIKTAKSIEASGADAIALTNTFKGLAVDIENKKPVLGSIFGGLSGPAIKPMALRHVFEVSKEVKIPIIGTGGISSWQDAVQFILSGATCVSVGTCGFVNPNLYLEIIKGLIGYLKQNNIRTINNLIGALKCN